MPPRTVGHRSASSALNSARLPGAGAGAGVHGRVGGCGEKREVWACWAGDQGAGRQDGGQGHGGCHDEQTGPPLTVAHCPLPLEAWYGMNLVMPAGFNVRVAKHTPCMPSQPSLEIADALAPGHIHCSSAHPAQAHTTAPAHILPSPPCCSRRPAGSRPSSTSPPCHCRLWLGGACCGPTWSWRLHAREGYMGEGGNLEGCP